MKIDTHSLTEAELIDLNNRIVERLRFLNQARAHVRVLNHLLQPPAASGRRRISALSAPKRMARC